MSRQDAVHFVLVGTAVDKLVEWCVRDFKLLD